jgi:phage repressor protein C with HTH and peptisase S24 domain
MRSTRSQFLILRDARDIKAMNIADMKMHMKRLNISQPRLAEMTGISFDSLNRLLAGKRQLKAKEAQQIGVILTRLSGDTGPDSASNSSVFEPSNITPLRAPSDRMVPVYGFALGSNQGIIHLEHASRTGVVRAHPGQMNSDHGFAVEIVDDSMSPRYESGELAYAVMGQMPSRGQDVIIEMTSGDAYIKRFVGLDAAAIIGEQHNPAKRVTYRTTEVRALHAVVGSGRR